MKIIVELNDNTLQHAVEAQVGKAVAAYTEAVIKAKVDEIVKLKLDRISIQDVLLAVESVARKHIDSVLGANNDYTRKNIVRGFLADAAEKAIKGAK